MKEVDLETMQEIQKHSPAIRFGDGEEENILRFFDTFLSHFGYEVVHASSEEYRETILSIAPQDES
jgi:hypothetical protein